MTDAQNLSPNHSSYWQMILAFSLICFVLVVDLTTQVEMALGALYILPLLTTLSLQKPHFSLLVAITSILFIIFGFFMSPDDEEPWKLVVNRTVSILIIWGIYMVMLRNIRTTFFLQSLNNQVQTELETSTQQFRNTQKATLSLLEDIEESKNALIRSEARNRLVVEAAPSGMVMINQAGVIVLANKLIAEQFGYPQNELLGQLIETLLPERFRGQHPGHRTGFFGDPEPRSMGSGRDLFGLRQDGTEFPVEIGLNPLTTEEGTFVLASVVDITERKKSEDTLKATNKELERFAYIASHDLKAPLRVIDNTSQWLEEDLAEHLTGDNRENMGLMRGRVRRMEKLLDDLLEYSRVGRSTDVRYQEYIHGAELIAEIIQLLAPPDGFIINVSPAFASIRVLKMPLQQILLNLLNNALKHHDQSQGIIQVDVEDQKVQYRITVTDDGPGIPHAFHEQVFDMFQTLKPRDQVEGSGMGLAMVKKHIDFAGGAVHLESVEGQGCTFIILWPKQHTMEGVPA